jgi:probable HAF family extracellular repeat protein
MVIAGSLAVSAPLVHAQTNASCTFHVFQIPVSGGVALPQGINRFGNIVGFVNLFTSHSEGFIRFSNGSTSIFKAPNSSNTSIHHRSDQGVNVGAFTPSGSTLSKGFAATSSRLQTVTFPGASQTFLTGINKFGTIVGDYIGSDNHFHGFKLKSGQFSTIHPNGAVDTFVSGINDSGVIVGAFNTGGVDNHGFVVRSGAISTLDFPHEVGFGGTTLNDISNSGEIVGFVWTGADTREAFLFKSGAFKVITVPHARLTEANGISNINVITGHAVVVSSTGAESDKAYTATCQ